MCAFLDVDTYDVGQLLQVLVPVMAQRRKDPCGPPRTKRAPTATSVCDICVYICI